MPSVTIRLNISAKELLKYYQGTASLVRARAEDGRYVQFPANVLRAFVTNTGIQGEFCIEYSAAGHFERITPL